MIFKKIVVGPIETNSYIIGSENTKEIALIDPGFEPNRIIEEVEKIKPKNIKVLLTHGHFDHSIHLDIIKEHFPDLILMYHEAEYNPLSKRAGEEDIERMILLMENYEHDKSNDDYKDGKNNLEFLRDFGLFTNIKADKWLKEGIKINLGEITLITLETPGHSPGSLCFYSNDVKELRGHLIDGIIFTGDLLLKRNVGEFNIPRGDERVLFSSIKNKIMHNPDLTGHFKICGGHFGETTIAEEKLFNPFRNHFL